VEVQQVAFVVLLVLQVYDQVPLALVVSPSLLSSQVV
jgi:hypothetical protein